MGFSGTTAVLLYHVSVYWYSNSSTVYVTLVYTTPYLEYHPPIVCHPGGHYSKILNDHPSYYPGDGVYIHTP